MFHLLPKHNLYPWIDGLLASPEMTNLFSVLRTSKLRQVLSEQFVTHCLRYRQVLGSQTHLRPAWPDRRPLPTCPARL